MPPCRDYQGKRYRLEDLQEESVQFFTTDQVQVAFLRLELLKNGELPERCKTCRWRNERKEVTACRDHGEQSKQGK